MNHIKRRFDTYSLSDKKIQMTWEAMMSIWETISLISNYWIQLLEENFGEQFHLSQIFKKQLCTILTILRF